MTPRAAYRLENTRILAERSVFTRFDTELGTGTQSGPNAGEQGCLLELSHGGKQPIAFPNGESRAFLEDGDVVKLRAWCERDGFVLIGSGVCSGEVNPCNVAGGEPPQS